MNARTRSTALATALMILVVVLSGCGQKKQSAGRTKPLGHLVENGTPVKASTANPGPGDTGMKVVFIPFGTADVDKQTEAVIFDASAGMFELVGADGKTIPAGKYRVAVTLSSDGQKDRFGGKFSRENTKIEVEVKEGEDLVIDVSKFN